MGITVEKPLHELSPHLQTLQDAYSGAFCEVNSFEVNNIFLV